MLADGRREKVGSSGDAELQPDRYTLDAGYKKGGDGIDSVDDGDGLLLFVPMFSVNPTLARLFSTGSGSCELSYAFYSGMLLPSDILILDTPMLF